MIKLKSLIFYLLFGIVSLGCVAQKGEVKVNINRKSAVLKSISSISVNNNQIKINGVGLSNVTSLKIKNSNLDENFTIESVSTNQIIANATRAISIGVGQTFDLILNSAEGAATFPVSFTLDNGSVTPLMLSTSGMNSGDILKFNGSAWVHVPLVASQLYVGGWDAATDSPGLVGQAIPVAGDYYIVTVAGSKNLGGGVVAYSVGDTIISNGTSWDLISGSGNSILKTGDTMSGVLTLDSDLKIKSSSNTNYVTIKAPALGASYNLTLPATVGTAGYVLSTNGSGVTSWVAQAAGGAGSVTNVTSANTDIGITAGTTIPVLTLNSGVGNNQIVKLNGSAQLPAVDGSLLTSLSTANFSGAVPVSKGGTGLTSGTLNTIPYFNSTSTMTSIAAGIADQVLRIPGGGGAPTFGAIDLTKPATVTGALLIANGGTGAATLGAAQSALGITIGGATTGSALIAGTGGVVANKICSGDSSGGGISCVNTTSLFLANSITDGSGAGALLFGTAPTIDSPVIANINPGADFTLTQNAVAPFISENTGAVANTLYLKAGKVGIGTNNPSQMLEVAGTIYSTTGGFKFPDGTTQTTTAGANYTNVGAFDGFSTNIYTGLNIGNAGTATGTSNEAFGDRALQALTSGTRNVAFGIYALNNVTSGASNIGVGQQAGGTITTGSNNIAIGNLANVPSATGSNQLSIANLIYGIGSNVGIGNNNPGSTMDVKGTLRLSGATSGYVGFAPAAAAGTTTYLLPITQGSAGQVLSTDGVATTPTLSWITPATTGTTLTGDIGGTIGANTIGTDKVTSTHILDGTIVDADINASAAIAQSKISGLTTSLSGKEPTITAGSSSQYLKGDKSLGTFLTDVMNQLLTGVSFATNSAVVAGDNLIAALGKLQAQITSILSTKLDKTGGTLTVGTIDGVPTPTTASQIVNKSYVDTLFANYSTITSATTAASGAMYLVDTSTAGFIVTLPTTPAVNTTIRFVDAKGTFATNNLTIAPNAADAVMNQAVGVTLVVDINHASFDLVYTGATYGWKLK